MRVRRRRRQRSRPSEREARQAEAIRKQAQVDKETRAAAAKAEAAAAKAEAAAKLKADKEAAAARSAEEKAAAAEAAAKVRAAKEAEKAAVERGRALLQADGEKDQAKEDGERARTAPAAMAVSASSPAGNVAQQRLDRSSGRLTGVLNRRRSSAGGDADGGGAGGGCEGGGEGSIKLSSVGASNAAAKSLLGKEGEADGGAADGGGGGGQSGLLSQSSARAASAWLKPWREGGGSRIAEIGYCGSFSGDCLACDEEGGDTIVGIGGDGDGTNVSVYSARKGEVTQVFMGHTDLVGCVALQGDLVVSGARDKAIRFWSRKTGKCTATLEGCEDSIYGLALRGDTLLSGEGSQKVGRVRQWAIKAQKLESTFAEKHGGPVWSVATNGDVAVSASFDYTAKVWPLMRTDGEVRSKATLKHPNWVLSVSVEADLAATGCGDRIVRLWSLSSFCCLRTLTHGSGFVANAVFSVRLVGGVLVSGSEDKTLKIWSLTPEDEGECIATLTHGATVKGLALSRKGGLLASAGGNLKKLAVWRAVGLASGAAQLAVLK